MVQDGVRKAPSQRCRDRRVARQSRKEACSQLCDWRSDSPCSILVPIISINSYQAQRSLGTWKIKATALKWTASLVKNTLEAAGLAFIVVYVVVWLES